MQSIPVLSHKQFQRFDTNPDPLLFTYYLFELAPSFNHEHKITKDNTPSIDLHWQLNKNMPRVFTKIANNAAKH